MKSRLFGALFLLGILGWILPNCAAPPARRLPPPVFVEREIPHSLSDDGDRESLLRALDQSLAYLEGSGAKRPESPFRPGIPGDSWDRERIRLSLSLFRRILSTAADEAEMNRRIRENFSLWELCREEESNPILLTGYYEPVIQGSLSPGGEYLYPLYARPADLLELAGQAGSSGRPAARRIVRVEDGREVPYYSRREIDTGGVLQGRGLELVWLRDPWERFVLHVQGSGQVRLPGGETLRVGYAASNGRPYRSIGRYLADEGFLERGEATLERIRDIVGKNPGRAEEIFSVNERYIFFRVLPDSQGPVGALGAVLTPGRSAAMDLDQYPPGALAYLVSRQPHFDEAGRLAGWKPLRRFVLNQDTGAAIQGPSRVDLFFGSGEGAGRAAGEMKEAGRIFFLLAR